MIIHKYECLPLTGKVKHYDLEENPKEGYYKVNLQLEGTHKADKFQNKAAALYNLCSMYVTVIHRSTTIMVNEIINIKDDKK